MKLKSASPVIAGLAFVLLGSTASLAADAQAFGDRLKDLAGKSSVPLSFAAANADGDNVVLTDVTVGTGADAGKLGDVTFENVTGSTAAGWKVASASIPDFVKNEDGKEASVTGMEIEGLQLAGSEGESTLPGGAQIFFDNASIGAVKVSQGGKALFSLAGTDLTNTTESGSGTIASTFTLGDFVLDFASLPADDSTKTMIDLGYPQLAGSGSVELSWNPQSGELSLDPLNISVKEAGDFTVAYQVNGYTPAFAKSLQQIQEQMAANPEAAQSSGMAILGLVSQLSIASLDITYEDASLTNKLLDYYAKQNGQTRDQLVQGILGTLPGVLGMLQNPEFQTEVSTAVETFLKDPKSLSIAMNPDAPVPATQIIGAAMGAPQTLPTVLQLEVTANDVAQ